MKAILDHKEEVALNIVTHWFKTEQPVEFTPGQYGRWYLPHPNADERGERHWFTISASPTEAPLVSFTTKFAPEHSSTFKQALQKLEPSGEIDFSGPFGDFVLPVDAGRQLVFIAGGIGVTPFRSIIKFLSDRNEKRNIHLIYAANKIEEVAFKNLFESYDLKLDLVIGERLSGQKVLDLVGGVKEQLFYFSGPEPMVEALVKDTQSLGLNAEQTVTDYFPGYTQF